MKKKRESLMTCPVLGCKRKVWRHAFRLHLLGQARSEVYFWYINGANNSTFKRHQDYIEAHTKIKSVKTIET